jgi:integrase
MDTMARRRANREGSIRQRPDGRWEAIVSTGYDPVTGKLKRVSFYGKTQKEALDKATAARHHLNRGTYVDRSRLTVGAWLTEWLETYKEPRVKILTLVNYSMIVRRHLTPALGHLALQALKADHVERYLAD